MTSARAPPSPLHVFSWNKMAAPALTTTEPCVTNMAPPAAETEEVTALRRKETLPERKTRFESAAAYKAAPCLDAVLLENSVYVALILMVL
jgi:hypothetical protein